MWHKRNSVVLAAALVLAAGVAQGVTLDVVTVGDPGNAADSTGYGAVSYTYQIGKYDVTTSQYAAFLNAVAATSDPYGLYYSGMAMDLPTFGITQTFVSGSYNYSVTGTAPGKENMPVFDVSWGDAARFCNWLQNGQGLASTETGAYTLNGGTSDAALMAVTRNAGATYFIPSENEWYKAAYYKGGGTNAGYWLYPTQNDSVPSNLLSALATNNANFYNNAYSDPLNWLSVTGTFASSPGPYATYDQGGDVFQWNEANIGGWSRGMRGGSFDGASDFLASSYRDNINPQYEYYDVGFRVASVPEPGSIAFVLAGAVGLLIWRLRRSA